MSLLTSEDWLFGDQWPGQRCGAKTRSGHPCKNPAVTGNRRCRLHGGAKGSGAPRGRRHGRYKHGRFTQAMIAGRRAQAAKFKEMVALGKAIGYFR